MPRYVKMRRPDCRRMPGTRDSLYNAALSAAKAAFALLLRILLAKVRF